MTKKSYAQNHFVLNRWILKYAGLWPPATESKLVLFLYRLYATFVFVFVNLWFTTSEFISIKDTQHDWSLLIKNINFALTHLMGACKCVFWFVRGDRLISIIETLEDTHWHYDGLPDGDFQPDVITHQAKRTGIKYTLAFFMLAHMTLSASYVPALLAAVFHLVYESDAAFAQRLPYFSWIPFQYNTPGTYVLAILYQAGPMWSYAYSIVGMDTLFMNIMNFVAAHLLILKGAFRTIKARCEIRLGNQGENLELLHWEMKSEMKKCVRHLQTVINCCEELDFNHRFLTLGQILATLFILCTSLFLVSTTPVGSKQFAAEMVYMVAMGFQLVLYCWFGNKVTTRFSEITGSIWFSDWLQTDFSFKSSMLITMIRIQKPLYLTVGQFAPLTLTTFVAVNGVWMNLPLVTNIEEF